MSSALLWFSNCNPLTTPVKWGPQNFHLPANSVMFMFTFQLRATLVSSPGLLHFWSRLVYSIIHKSGRVGRHGNTYHVNDVRWTRGGRRGEGRRDPHSNNVLVY